MSKQKNQKERILKSKNLEEEFMVDRVVYFNNGTMVRQKFDTKKKVVLDYQIIVRFTYAENDLLESLIACALESVEL